MSFRQTIDDPSAAAVVAWRRRHLVTAGFTAELADALAEDLRVDLHALLALVDRGCPPPLAARILAPLERLCDASSETRPPPWPL